MKTKMVVVVSMFVIAGFSVNVFAGMGRGMGMMGGNYGMEMSKQGVRNNLSEDQIKQANEERKRFFNSTEDIKQQVYEKELELKYVLAKKSPDAQYAMDLQKQLSMLETQFNQKRIEHIIKMKKIDPNCREFGRRNWRQQNRRNQSDFGYEQRRGYHRW